MYFIGHKFDVNSENFQLRHIMEAPLLENKDDIEDICISAVKEKDIEAKLKQVCTCINNFIEVNMGIFVEIRNPIYMYNVHVHVYMYMYIWIYMYHCMYMYIYTITHVHV